MCPRSRLLPLLALAILVAGCPQGLDSSVSSDSSPQTPVVSVDAMAAARGGAAVSTTLSAADLDPVLRPVGPGGAVPSEIVVQFASEAVTDDVVGSATEGTVVVVDPPTEGTAVFTSRSTLVFRPEQPFMPKTLYRVKLQSVGTRDGVVQAPHGASWLTEFRTPAFAVGDLQVSAADLDDGVAELTLSLTAPVLVSELNSRMFVLIDGEVPRSADWRTVSDRPGTLVLRIEDGRLEHGMQVEIGVAKGLPMQGRPSVVLGSFQRTAEVLANDLVSIVALSRMEGPTGHYIDVVCDDTGAEGYHGWYWVESTGDWLRISPRCIPDERSVADFITLDPPLPYSVSPTRHGFRVLADFDRGAYSITIREGLRTTDGSTLRASYSTGVTVPPRSPQVAFVAKGRYLSSGAWKSVGVRHLNVDELDVTIRQVPRDNLVFWLSGEDEGADARTSDLVVESKVAVSGPVDEFGQSSLNLRRLIPGAPEGVYEVTIASAGSSDVSRLLATDLNLVVKRSGSGDVHGWALGMHDNAPQRGVLLELVQPSGTVAATCMTGPDGGCKLDIDDERLDPTPSLAVVASRGSDLTYVRFADLELEAPDSATEGEPWGDLPAYRIATWTDRGVYRPGDVAHIAGVVRDRNDRAVSGDLPIRMSVADPNGNTLLERTLHPNVAGLIVDDVEFGDFATTGRWTTTFRIADEVIATGGLHVEEFVPERLKVSAAAVASDVLIGEPVSVDVDAAYLFGGSAEGSAVELGCEVRAVPFTPAKNAGFRYGPWHADGEEPAPIDLGAATGEIGPDGRVRLSCPALQAGGSAGGGQVVARAAVFEGGSGRSSQITTSARLHPERHHVGLDSGEQEVSAGKSFTVSGVVVDWTGELTAGVAQVDVELFRLVEEYGLMWDASTHTERWRRYLRKVSDGGTQVSVEDGRFTVPVTPTADSAGYLVRVRAGEAMTDLKLEGKDQTWWWWGDDEDVVDATPRPLRPGTVEVEVPEFLEVGKTAEVRFIAPQQGRALIAVETDEVVEHAWIEISKPGPVTWSFVPKKRASNVYVTVLHLKDPHLESRQAFLPGRSWGVASAPIRPTELIRTVELEVPDEVQPNETLTVHVDAGQGAGWATVAAVDVGILQLTRFETPDPLADLFPTRRLDVDSFETVGWTLLNAPDGMSRPTGGDEAPSALGRVQMVKPVALWSGLVELDGDGRATIELPVPTYRGALRVMAVVADGTRVGSADAEVLVRDPLVLVATTPRFLVGGDRFEIPVFVTNTTDKRREVVVEMDVSEVEMGGAMPVGPVAPPVTLDEGGRGTVLLEPGRSGTVVFRGVASRPVGAARFAVSATSGELSSRDELEVPLMPRGALSRQVQRIDLREGTLDLDRLLAGWVPTTERTTFWVTTNPFGDVFGHLSWLIRYPYGCIEQTTSSTRPLLYVRRLLDYVDPSFGGRGGVDAMVDSGINRVLSMQTASGGLSYWPGGSQPVTWGTAYGVHLLLDAKEAGYAVPQESLDRAITWLDGAVESSNTSYGHSEEYGHYVLARAGKPHKARIEQLLSEMATSGNEGGRKEREYLLQAALYLAGDRRWEQQLRNPDISALTDVRENSWSFYSDRRRRALVLDVMVDMFGRDKDTEPLANLVARGLSEHGHGWYTTQEVAWGMSALGKWLSGTADDFAEPELRLAGRVVEPTTTAESGPERSWSVYRASEYGDAELTLNETGSGNVFLVVSSQGIRDKAPSRVGGNGLALTRLWQAADGKLLSPDGGDGPTPELGDLVYTTLTLKNTSGERVQNVALVDRFAAGWEVENPRLGREHAPAWAETGSEWSVDHMNVRDDRMELFGALGPGESVSFTYALRAVTAGEFTAPAASAEAMYDPRLWARTAPAAVVVLGPWGGMTDAEE